MKIAIINENSQAPKNGIIEAALKKVVEPMGHEVVNYGMYFDASPRLTYVQCGILAAILLNSGAADFVITGCGAARVPCCANNRRDLRPCGGIPWMPTPLLRSTTATPCPCPLPRASAGAVS